MLERSCRHFVVLLDLKRFLSDLFCRNDVEDELGLEMKEPVATAAPVGSKISVLHMIIFGHLYLLLTAAS